MTVVTQFITEDGTDNGDLVEIRRLYVQDGQVNKHQIIEEIIDKQTKGHREQCDQLGRNAGLGRNQRPHV